MTKLLQRDTHKLMPFRNLNKYNYKWAVRTLKLLQIMSCLYSVVIHSLEMYHQWETILLMMMMSTSRGEDFGNDDNWRRKNSGICSCCCYCRGGGKGVSLLLREEYCCSPWVVRSFSYVLGGYIITIFAYGERRQYSAAVSLSLSLDDIKKSLCVKILSSTLFIDAFLSLFFSR